MSNESSSGCAEALVLVVFLLFMTPAGWGVMGFTAWVIVQQVMCEECPPPEVQPPPMDDEL